MGENNNVEELDLESVIKSKFEDSSKLHMSYLVDTLCNSNMENMKDITLTGLLNGLNAILLNNYNIDFNEVNKNLCEEVISMIDKLEDKRSAVLALSKVCSDIMLQNDIVQDVINK